MTLLAIGQRPIAQGFNAADYGTVIFWLNGADNTKVLDSGGSPCANNGSVDKWTDGGTGNRNARQTTGANRPVYKTNIQNSQSVIDFTNTSSQYFVFENALDVAKNRSGLTLVTVHKPVLQEQFQMIFYVQDNGGADRISTYVTDQGGGVYKPQTDANRTDGGTAYTLYDAGNLSYSAWDILIWVWDFANGTWAVYNRNSTVRADSSTQFGGTGSTSNTNANVQPQLGQYSGTSIYNGQIGEVVMYDGAMDSTNRSNLKTALGTKWGITVA